ncbi:MAG: MBL fold metallo-hydrolase [Bacteroidota bacterium]|nr:MBL fold metallo-hydrolase [Bacteroidota bacterium]
MVIKIIDTGFFKLDGGAMFGIVPKVIWQKTNPADDLNLCTWAMRCLLVEDGNKLMLVDCGIGDKQDQKFFCHFHLHGRDSLLKSIHKAGYSPDEITDVFLTHLHFDHCGGAVFYNKNSMPELTFKNAQYWSNEAHWAWAINANAREGNSFLKENIIQLQESGHLNFIAPGMPLPIKNMNIIYVDGHTEKQMLPKFHINGKTFIYIADLVPSVGHIPLPYVMGYDVRPLVTLKEKESILEEAADNNYFLIFEHDPTVECCTLKRTDKGIRLGETFKLNELIG